MGCLPVTEACFKENSSNRKPLLPAERKFVNNNTHIHNTRNRRWTYVTEIRSQQSEHATTEEETGKNF